MLFPPPAPQCHIPQPGVSHRVFIKCDISEYCNIRQGKGRKKLYVTCCFFVLNRKERFESSVRISRRKAEEQSEAYKHISKKVMLINEIL